MFSYTLLHSELTWVALIARDGELTQVLMLDGPRAAADAEVHRLFPEARMQPGLLPELQKRLKAYFAGEATRLDVPVKLTGLTEFQQEVLRACRRIPAGRTLTYAELAARIGRPRAARAVGNALARNPLPLLVPCHRVVAGNRRLGGFSAQSGVALKRKLLALEGAEWDKPRG